MRKKKYFNLCQNALFFYKQPLGESFIHSARFGLFQQAVAARHSCRRGAAISGMLKFCGRTKFEELFNAYSNSYLY